MSRFAGASGEIVVVGHRGGRGEGWPPENTLDAFARAVDEGAHAIELDVRTCATGEAVVFHDADLARMTRGDDARKVSQLPMKDLVRVRLAGGARIPTLAEVLDWAATRCAVNVELKRDVASRPLLARAAATAIRDARADVLVSSFDAPLLTSMRALAPRTLRAYLVEPRGGSDARSVFAPLDRNVGLHAVHFGREQAGAENVTRARACGLHVGVWTVNEGDEAKALAKLGIGWVITDAPGEIRAALAA